MKFPTNNQIFNPPMKRHDNDIDGKQRQAPPFLQFSQVVEAIELYRKLWNKNAKNRAFGLNILPTLHMQEGKTAIMAAIIWVNYLLDIDTHVMVWDEKNDLVEQIRSKLRQMLGHIICTNAEGEIRYMFPTKWFEDHVLKRSQVDVKSDKGIYLKKTKVCYLHDEDDFAADADGEKCVEQTQSRFFKGVSTFQRGSKEYYDDMTARKITHFFFSATNPVRMTTACENIINSSYADKRWEIFAPEVPKDYKGLVWLRDNGYLHQLQPLVIKNEAGVCEMTNWGMKLVAEYMNDPHTAGTTFIARLRGEFATCFTEYVKNTYRRKQETIYFDCENKKKKNLNSNELLKQTFNGRRFIIVKNYLSRGNDIEDKTGITYYHMGDSTHGTTACQRHRFCGYSKINKRLKIYCDLADVEMYLEYMSFAEMYYKTKDKKYLQQLLDNTGMSNKHIRINAEGVPTPTSYVHLDTAILV